MPLAYRTRFYDADEVAAIAFARYRAAVAAGDFNARYDYGAVLRAEGCLEPTGRTLPDQPRARGGWARVREMRPYRTEREKRMVDPSEHEQAALEAASAAGGAYLETLGKTDMARMTPDEWMGFLDAVVSGFQDKLAELHEPKETGHGR